MKKIIPFLLLVLIILSLIGCNQSNKVNNGVSKSTTSEPTPKSHTKFSEDEINEATNCVKVKFKDFKGCTLTKLWYDEEKSNSLIEGYFKNRSDSLSKVRPENAIILLSNFDVSAEGTDGSLNPNSTYSDWNWILIRDSKTTNWKVVDWGY